MTSILLKSLGQFSKISSIFFLLASMVHGQTVNTTVAEQTTRYFHDIKSGLAAKGYRADIKEGQYGSILAGRECKSKLVLELTSDPMAQQRNTILAECTDKKSWKLYLSLDITVYAPVVVSTSTIARNQVISEQDLVLQEQQVNKGRYPYFSDIKNIIGLTAKQSLRAGATITPNQLKSPTLVKRGDRVVIYAKNDAVSVKMDGVALNEGRLGDQVDVRNSRSDKVVRGFVVERGMISITL